MIEYPKFPQTEEERKEAIKIIAKILSEGREYSEEEKREYLIAQQENTKMLKFPNGLSPTKTLKITNKFLNGKEGDATIDIDALYKNFWRIDGILYGQEICRNACEGLEKCSTHGFYNYFFEDDKHKLCFSCEPCHEIRKSQKEYALNKLIKNSKVPPQFKEATWVSFHVDKSNEKAYKAAVNFVKTLKKGLYIHGKKGVGKTLLLSIMANQLILNQKNVLYVCAPEFTNDLKRAIKNDQTADVLDAAKEADVLIIDDLGAEKESEWLSEQLFILFNHRYNYDLPVVISSNITPSNLTRHFYTGNNTAGRIVNRIAAMTDDYYMSGDNLRLFNNV